MGWRTKAVEKIRTVAVGSAAALSLAVGTAGDASNRTGWYVDVATPGSEELHTVVGGLDKWHHVKVGVAVELRSDDFRMWTSANAVTTRCPEYYFSDAGGGLLFVIDDTTSAITAYLDTEIQGTLDVTGAATVASLTSTGDIQGADFISTGRTLRRNVQNDFLELLMGTTGGTDARIFGYGSTHATNANKIFYDAASHEFRSANGLSGGAVSAGSVTATTGKFKAGGEDPFNTIGNGFQYGDTSADFVVPCRFGNNSNDIESYQVLTGSTGASFGLANTVFHEALRDGGTSDSTIVLSAFGVGASSVRVFTDARSEKARFDVNGITSYAKLITTPTTGEAIKLGSTASTSTVSPVTINMGGTYSPTAAAALKLRLYEDGALTYGIGISVGQIDYVAPQAADKHRFYIGGGLVFDIDATDGVKSTRSLQAFGGATTIAAQTIVVDVDGTVGQRILAVGPDDSTPGTVRIDVCESDSGGYVNTATFKSNTTNLNLPTSSAGLSTGDLWNDSGTVKVA